MFNNPVLGPGNGRLDCKNKPIIQKIIKRLELPNSHLREPLKIKAYLSLAAFYPQQAIL